MLREETIRGLRTTWIQAGPTDAKLLTERPVLFFLHGFPDTAETWAGQTAEFSAAGFPVLASNLRGVGGSEPSPTLDRYHPDAVLLDQLQTLRQVDPDARSRIVVIGHDIGGIYAWDLARALGDRLAGLILINAPALEQLLRRAVRSPTQVLKSSYIALFQIPGISELAVKHLVPRLLKRPLPEGAEEELRLYRGAVRAIPRALLSKPTRIHAPVLVLWGKRDPYLEVPTEAEYGNLADQVEIRVLDEGHWMHSRKPERVNPLIARFVERLK